MRRLFRDGVVLPAEVSDVSAGRGLVVWVTVRFTLASGARKTMRCNAFETAASLRSAGELAVLLDPNDPRVAVLLTPSERCSLGEVEASET